MDRVRSHGRPRRASWRCITRARLLRRAVAAGERRAALAGRHCPRPGSSSSGGAAGSSPASPGCRSGIRRRIRGSRRSRRSSACTASARCCSSSAGALVALVRGSTRTRAIAAVVLIAPWLVSRRRSRGIEWTQPSGKPVGVAIVQGAIPQDMKWLEANHDATLNLYRELAESAFGTPLIVFPEASLPRSCERAPDYLRVAVSGREQQGLGCRARHPARRSDEHAGLLQLGARAGRRQVQWYDKNHLVPFAEFFPVPISCARGCSVMKPAVCGLHARRQRAAAAARRRAQAGHDHLLRGWLRQLAARGAERGGHAGERDQRCVVRARQRAPSAFSDRAHARDRSAALHAARGQRRHLRGDRPAWRGRGARRRASSVTCCIQRSRRARACRLMPASGNWLVVSLATLASCLRRSGIERRESRRGGLQHVGRPGCDLAELSAGNFRARFRQLLYRCAVRNLYSEPRSYSPRWPLRALQFLDPE